MQMSEAVEVVEASSVEDADEFLDTGWKLLTVVAGNRYVSGQLEIGPIYVLGKPKELEHDIKDFVMGKHVTG